MGTDIHGAIEVNVPDLGWEYVASIWLMFDRSYENFGKFFGVRNYAEVNPIWPANNPIDLSVHTREQIDLDSGHDIACVCLADLLTFGSTGWNDMEFVKSLMTMLSTRYGVSNVRLVVWFDG